MTKTPLRRYLDDERQTAESFATEHGLSSWSVRHWARGDKEPNPDSQRKIEVATSGKVGPEDWLRFRLDRENPSPASEAA